MLIGSGLGFVLWMAFAIHSLVTCEAWERPNYAALVVFFLMLVGCGFYGGAAIAWLLSAFGASF